MLRLYEEKRRNVKSNPLPSYVLRPSTQSYLTFERYYLDTALQSAIFYFSVDGNTDESEWLVAELSSNYWSVILQHTNCSDLHQAMIDLGLCILCWLFMQYPRHLFLVKAGTLSHDELQFWNASIEGFLLEFLWLNGIPFSPKVVTEISSDTLVNICRSSSSIFFQSDFQMNVRQLCIDRIPCSTERKNILIPLGGGKDALTLIELLKDSSFHIENLILLYLIDASDTSFNWRLQPLIDQTELTTCVSMTFIPPRRLPNLSDTLGMFSTKEDDFIDGTPPWSALVAFISNVVAGSMQCHSVIVGNERSANEGSGAYWLSQPVNHQYDKSLIWEVAVCTYFLNRYNFKEKHFYFSGLMPWWEIQIMRRFTRKDCLEKYIALFMSCNHPSSTSRWCASCPKCAFVFLLLSAFVTPSQAWSVFGNNLLEDRELLPVYRSLLGLGGLKPLECVGTAQETLLAFYFACERYAFSRRLPFVLSTLISEVASQYPQRSIHQCQLQNMLLEGIGPHNIPNISLYAPFLDILLLN